MVVVASAQLDSFNSLFARSNQAGGFNNIQIPFTAPSKNGETGFGIETLTSIIPIVFDPTSQKSALNMATTTLDFLSKILKNIPSSVKGDIRKVNGIVADVCNNNTSEGTKATCDSINKITHQISQGFDNPDLFFDKLKLMFTHLFTFIEKITSSLTVLLQQIKHIFPAVVPELTTVFNAANTLGNTLG